MPTNNPHRPAAIDATAPAGALNRDPRPSDAIIRAAAFLALDGDIRVAVGFLETGRIREAHTTLVRLSTYIDAYARQVHEKTHAA